MCFLLDSQTLPVQVLVATRQRVTKLEALLISWTDRLNVNI